MTIKPVAWQATEAGQFHYTQDAGKAMEWANAGIVLTPLCCSHEAVAEIERLQSELRSLKNMNEKEHTMPNLEAVMQFGEYGKPSRALCYQDEAMEEIERLRAENADLRHILSEARNTAHKQRADQTYKMIVQPIGDEPVSMQVTFTAFSIAPCDDDMERCPSHPGALLSDILPDTGKTKVEIANLLGISRQQLHDIMTEKKPLSPKIAARIGKLFGMGAGVWMRMQAAHDAWEADHTEDLDDIPTLTMWPRHD